MRTNTVMDPTADGFPHGEPLGASRGCRCTPCRRAQTKAGQLRELANARGEGPRMDARPVQEHLRALLQAPTVTYAAIGRAAGVDKSTVRWILELNTCGACSRRVGQRLLGVTAEQATAHAICNYYPAQPARDMIRRLQAHGWSLTYLAERLGNPGQTAPTMLFRRSPTITAATWEQVQALYAELQAKPGPSQMARRTARRLGYYPPAAYDEDGTLVPGAGRRLADDAAGAGKVKNDRERMHRQWFAIMRLTLAGLSAEDIAAHQGTTKRAVERRREYLGIEWEWDGHYALALPGQEWEVAALRDAVREQELQLRDPVEHWEWLVAHLAQYRLGVAMAVDAERALMDATAIGRTRPPVAAARAA